MRRPGSSFELTGDNDAWGLDLGIQGLQDWNPLRPHPYTRKDEAAAGTIYSSLYHRSCCLPSRDLIRQLYSQLGG